MFKWSISNERDNNQALDRRHGKAFNYLVFGSAKILSANPSVEDCQELELETVPNISGLSQI